MDNPLIRLASRDDNDAIWAILEPIFREGETYPIDPQVSREDGLTYWFAARKTVFVYEQDGQILGTYYLCPNSTGPAAHVANCGYAVSPAARGKGVARAMCLHSFDAARTAGFRAMQYNLVVATNTIALALWKKLGMEEIGVIKGAFNHKRLGYVDAHILYRELF